MFLALALALPVSVFQRRPDGGAHASCTGSQAAAGWRPGPQHRGHGGLLPHPSGRCQHFLPADVLSLVLSLTAPALLVVQVSRELLQQITETVLQKTVDGMKGEGTPYVGKCTLLSSTQLHIRM